MDNICVSKQSLLKDYEDRWRRIQEAMTRAGIPSQVALAKKLGVSQPSVSGWKKGDFLPEMRHMVRLADLSGLCVEYLWLGRGPKIPGERISRDAEQLLDILENLPEDQRKSVVRFAEFQSKD